MPAPDRDANTIPGQTVDAAWERLEAQFELSGGFWLGFVFSAAPQAADALRKKRNTLFQDRGLRWHDHLLSDPNALAKTLIWLLTSEEPLDVDCVWVEAIRVDSPGASEQPWTRAWEQLFLRTNEHRDALRARLRGGLVFAAPSSIMPLVREAAPDLWSVRSIVVNVELAPSMRVPNPVPSDYPNSMEATGQIEYWTPHKSETALYAGPIAAKPSRSGPPPPTASTMPAITSLRFPGSTPLPPLPPPIPPTRPSPSKPRGIPPPRPLTRPSMESGSSSQTSVARQPFALPTRHIVEAWISEAKLDAAKARILQALSEFGTEELIEKAFAYHLLARVCAAQEDNRTALQSIEEAVTIHGRISPDLVPLDWYELATVIARKNGQLARAGIHSFSGIAQCRRRLRIKESIDVLRELGFALKNHGEHERHQNDMVAAIEAFDEAVLVARRLVDLSNDDALDLIRLSECLLGLGDTRTYRNDFVGALATFEESVKVNRKIAALVGNTIPVLRALSVCLNRLGHLRQETGDHENALQAFEESLTIRRQILQENEPQSLRDLASVLTRIGLFYLVSGHDGAAAQALEESVIWNRQLKLLPATSNDAWYNLAFALYHLGRAQERLDLRDKAKRNYDEAIVLARELLKLPTESPNTRLLLEHAEKARALLT